MQAGALQRREGPSGMAFMRRAMAVVSERLRAKRLQLLDMDSPLPGAPVPERSRWR